VPFIGRAATSRGGGEEINGGNGAFPRQWFLSFKRHQGKGNGGGNTGTRRGVSAVARAERCVTALAEIGAGGGLGWR
jgi:hypothetical protein